MEGQDFKGPEVAWVPDIGLQLSVLIESCQVERK